MIERYGLFIIQGMAKCSWLKLRTAAIIAAALTLLLCGAAYTAVSEAVKPVPATVNIVYAGDANQDYIINSLDITEVERIIAGIDSPTAGADANLDGDLNAIDITRVERWIAGLDKVGP